MLPIQVEELFTKFHILLPGRRCLGPKHKLVSQRFWEKVFQVKEVEEKEIVRLVSELEVSFSPEIRYYFRNYKENEYFYTKNYELCERFFRTLETRIEKYGLKWYWVQAKTGHKGIHWGDSIPDVWYAIQPTATPQGGVEKTPQKRLKKTPQPLPEKQESLAYDGLGDIM